MGSLVNHHPWMAYSLWNLGGYPSRSVSRSDGLPTKSPLCRCWNLKCGQMMVQSPKCLSHPGCRRAANLRSGAQDCSSHRRQGEHGLCLWIPDHKDKERIRLQYCMTCDIWWHMYTYSWLGMIHLAQPTHVQVSAWYNANVFEGIICSTRWLIRLIQSENIGPAWPSAALFCHNFGEFGCPGPFVHIPCCCCPMVASWPDHGMFSRQGTLPCAMVGGFLKWGYPFKSSI